MAVIQSYYLNSLANANAKFNWSVGVLPKGTHRYSQTGFHGISVSAGTKHPELAWKLARFLAYDPEGAVLFTRAENRVPVMRETATDFAQRYARLLQASAMSAYTESPPYAWDVRVTRHPKGTQLLTTLVNASTRASQGQMSVRAVMEQVAPTIRALLRER